MWFFQAGEKLRAKPPRREPTEHMKSQRASMAEADGGRRQREAKSVRYRGRDPKG